MAAAIPGARSSKKLILIESLRREYGSHQHLDFSLMTLMLDFWPPQL